MRAGWSKRLSVSLVHRLSGSVNQIKLVSPKIITADNLTTDDHITGMRLPDCFEIFGHFLSPQFLSRLLLLVVRS